LRKADAVAVPLPALCEFVWVLRKVYGLAPDDVAVAIRALVAADNVLVNRSAVELGLALLMRGGDFADGVIAHEGVELGGDTFVSFDKKAANALAELGIATNLLC
jgi:predicted nucleic-acid-binding protein